MVNINNIKEYGGKIDSASSNRFDSDDGQAEGGQANALTGLGGFYNGKFMSKSQRAAFLTQQRQLETERQRQKEEEKIGRMKQDLELEMRSEFGFDGTETYFEAYLNDAFFILENLFLNFNTYNHFILGSSTEESILGSAQLGSILLSSSRQAEINAIQDFSEDFTTATYKDASTTANWTTTGSLTFGSGSVAIVSNWKSGSFELTTFDRFRVDVDFTTFGSGLLFETSFNGGSNFTQVFQSIESSIPNTGSDFRFRITDPTQTSVITKLAIITKGENFPSSS